LRNERFHETYPATAFLLLFNIAFFILEIIEQLKLTHELPRLLNVGGIDPGVTSLLGALGWSGIRHGEYWRLVTSAFLHGGFLHILMNGMVLVDLGRFCEPLLSSWKFVVAYGVSTIGGAVGSLIGHKLGAGHVDSSSVGASGALCGLIGLLLVYSLKERQSELRDGLLRWIVWIAILSVYVPGIDHAGHLGGFIAGGAFGFTVSDYIDSRSAPRWRYPGMAVAVAGIACLGFGLWHYFANR
jgi:rhomboid protease GluP